MFSNPLEPFQILVVKLETGIELLINGKSMEINVMRDTLPRILSVFSAAVMLLLPAQAGVQPSKPSNVKEFYVHSVHFDGNANINGDESHPPEPFPDSRLPKGGGLQLTSPDDRGRWKMRSFVFAPSQMTVFSGDHVRLNFVGVHGPKHSILITGPKINEMVEVTRGTMKTVDFFAADPGEVSIYCHDHRPSMTATVLVLKR
ncbi:hypothetical protein [Sphingorhabdus sp. EL138]|uniref:cupredoxin domain-containing protein n=1 Tax=Sphingorhabdus sp. EL138 TaxID=2073156 RepID=UPI000D699FD5|nr:hypothetical protein [Sphingorhabdus sp. EL138]